MSTLTPKKIPWFLSRPDRTVMVLDDFSDDDSNRGDIRSLPEESRLPFGYGTRQNLYSLCFKVTLIALLAASAFIGGLRYQATDSRTCFELQSAYSPVTKHIDQNYYPVKFNGSIFHESIYTNDPSPETDAAWDHISIDMGIMSLSSEEMIKADLSTNYARLPAEFGGGYMAAIEVFHQIHCVNYLRKSLFFNYEYYSSLGEHEFRDSPDMVKRHLNHCLNTLRQVLMCSADVGIFSNVWVHNYTRWQPDFNRVHLCRNFQNVLDYAYAMNIPKEPAGHRWTPLPEDHIWADIP